MIHIFKHETDGINAAIAEDAPGLIRNGQVCVPSIMNVKAVARMPRVMRAQIRARAVRTWATGVFEECECRADILLDGYTVLRTVEHNPILGTVNVLTVGEHG